ncbi:MAG: ABC transporter substrate-binding protein [Promethearchaeota archaeon]
MKRQTRISIYILLFFSMFIPTLPAILVKAQGGPITYRTSSSALIVSGDWDAPNSDGYNILMGYYVYATEFLCSGYATYFAGTKGVVKEDEWWPILATSWETEYRLDNESNSHPLGSFNNTGGRKAIEFTLREGVKFHDGSDWNATVAKWNIDRLYLITGNLTGNANGPTDQRNEGTYWNEVVATKDSWTASWNLSEYDAPDATVTPVFSPPDPSRYSYYYLTDPDGPSPVIANNSNPYGGFDAVLGNFIHYAPYDSYPLVRWVEITEDKQSGGKIKVHFNSWNSYGMEGMWVRQISYQAYHNDYTETAIYGYESGNDMIGTGPYIFEEHDEIADRGYMTKNMNYWNRTALEADGWFDVERFEIVQFPQGQIGIDARNVALQTHQIDYAYDNVWLPIDYDYVIASPNINYREDYPLEYVTQLTLNSINETWWSGGEMYTGMPWEFNFSWVDINGWYPHEQGDPGGIPRALRKALNYAFDYDTMINVNLDGRAVRASFTGVGSVFYNASVPQATYDLEYARQVLYNQNGSDPYSLTQPWWPINFTALMDARGLTNFTDATANNLFWQNVADTNPIFKMEVFWDDTHQDLKDLYEVAANNLGVKFVDEHGGSNKAPTGTILWDLCIGKYWLPAGTFDGYHSIWSSHSWMMDYDYPMTIGEGWYHANYGDPSYGVWRTTGVPTVYWPTWNFGFNYDGEIDYWLAVMYYSDPQRKIETISKIANKEMNELYPMVWCYQTTGGEALWANWDTFYALDRRGEPAPFWGLYSAHFLSYTPGEEFPLIPGAPLLLTLTGTAASMVGIIWAIMRKKRR